MAWTTPATQTTSTHITAAVWNEQITDNMSHLGNTHTHDGSAGGGSPYGLLPQGIILMADAACPAGWTRVNAFDGLFVRGAATYGATGGGGTHIHSHLHSAAHTHNQQAGTPNQQVNVAAYIAAASVSGSAMYVTAGDGSALYIMLSGFDNPALNTGTDETTETVLPAYISVIFCKND